MEKSVVGLMERRLLPESVSVLFSKAIVTGNFDCAETCVMLFGYFTHNQLFAQRLITKDHIKSLIILLNSTKDIFTKKHIRALLFDYSLVGEELG